jgi:hypothetical protein
MDPLLFLVLFLLVAILGVLGWVVLFCIRVRHQSMIAQRIIKRVFKMDIDELLTSLPDVGPRSTPVGVEPPQLRPADAQASMALIGIKRARIATQIAGGQRLVFKGKTVTPEMVDTMPDSDVEELNARVEARLGAAMSKSLGSSLLHLYTSAASTLLPIPAEDKKILAKELEEDPLVCTWLQATCCELYYRYGMYLAPLSAAVITAKHCDWQQLKTSNEGNDRSEEAYSGEDSCRMDPEEPATS